MLEHLTAVLILIAIVLISRREPAAPSRKSVKTVPPKANVATPTPRIERERRRTLAFRKQEARFFASFGHPQRPRTDEETLA